MDKIIFTKNQLARFMKDVFKLADEYENAHSQDRETARNSAIVEALESLTVNDGESSHDWD